MPTVYDILHVKGDQVHSIRPGATVMEAIDKMNQHKIGALVVMEEDVRRVAGIFTERDVLRRVIGEQRSPQQTRVSEVMTSKVICVSINTDIDEVSAIMKNRRIRHLPVCDDDNRLHGLISIGDVNAFNASNQEATIHFLNEYIYGRV